MVTIESRILRFITLTTARVSCEKGVGLTGGVADRRNERHALDEYKN